jgi:hypothetical protein
MSFDKRKLDAVRELCTSEIAQVSGGCQMGSGCNCPGSSHELSPDGSIYVTNACDGSIFISQSHFTYLLAA